MHENAPDDAISDHFFLGADHDRNERRTWGVIALTAAMMVAEIVAGLAYGSMALLADGFHMATHAGALTISALAYLFARRHADDPRFSFGTGKLGALAGFASAIVLAIVALAIGAESGLRLVAPTTIRFDEAILVAVLGLAVNLASAWMLRGAPHDHGHGGDHQRHAHHRADTTDHNLRAAYVHVLTDALTSLLAIGGLMAGRFFGWVWMDPAMGIVGAVIIARWTVGLLRDSGAVLLDADADAALSDAIRRTLEREGDRVLDLHLWRVGPGHLALIVALTADDPRPPAHYKGKIAHLSRLSHVTIEVHPA
jgi:cation diffusion facilitator family transporter